MYLKKNYFFESSQEIKTMWTLVTLITRILCIRNSLNNFIQTCLIRITQHHTWFEIDQFLIYPRYKSWAEFSSHSPIFQANAVKTNPTLVSFSIKPYPKPNQRLNIYIYVYIYILVDFPVFMHGYKYFKN